MKTISCLICSKEFPPNMILSGHGIRHEIESLLIKDYPDWTDASHICKSDYEKYRTRYLTDLIKEERGQIEKLEAEVIDTIKNNDILSANLNSELVYRFGERVSDSIAKFGGSWKFILSFFFVLFFWILINSYTLLQKPFDPFPFILLNLVLSCIAAIQAPVIMMSQNRQEAKDRLRLENDYKINLKAEIEIRTLHEKLDHLLLEQWSKMIEIQQLQIDLLKEIREKTESSR
jgi:uncharacterized membrane protein